MMAQRAVELVRDPARAAAFSKTIRAHALSIANRDDIYAAERTMYEKVIAGHQADRLA